MKQRQINEKKAFRFKRFARKSYSAFNSMHKVVNIGVISGCMLTFAHTTAVAQESTTVQKQPEILEEELKEVMVTASRVAMPLNQAAKAITVITSEQIAQAPVQSIEDLLIYVAGVDVRQRGGHGVQADISVRGGLADQTAILLNGINLSNSQTGHYSFDIPINLSDIERIEIIQGSSSLIYGVSAFAGGINIITKKNPNEKGYMRVSGGGHALVDAEGRSIVKTKTTTNSLSIGYKHSDGYTPNSNYNIWNVLWQTSLYMKNKSNIDFQLGYNNKHYGANTFYSGAFPNQYERTDMYMGSVKGSFGSVIKVIPALYWTRHHDRFDLIKNDTYGQNHHRNDMYGGSLNLQYKWKLGTTNVGGEIRRDEILSSNLGKDSKSHGAYYNKYDSRTNNSFAVEHAIRLNKMTLTAGIMANYSSNEDTWRYLPAISAGYWINDHFKLQTSWSKGMRQPTFTDLYYKAPTHSGNDTLRTERSENLELGVKYQNKFISAYATSYLMWGKNMIDWIQRNNSKVWESTNILELDKKGIELGVKFQLGEVYPFMGKKSYIDLNYVRQWQDRNKAGNGVTKSNYVLDYLRDKFTAALNHKVIDDNLTFGWYFRMQDRMGGYKKYRNGVEDTYLTDYPFYATLDLKINYKLSDFDFNLSSNNLFNRRYYDLGNVPQPGFWLIGGVSHKF